MNRLVPIGEAQTNLGGISRTTLYRLIAEGKLMRANIGRRAFITSDSIEEYLEKVCTTRSQPNVVDRIDRVLYGGYNRT